VLTSVYNHEQIIKVLDDVIHQLHDVIDNDLKFSLNLEKDHVIVYTKLQAMFNMKFVSELHQQIYNVILTSAISSEKMCPGTFDECIRSLLEYFSLHDVGNCSLNNKIKFKALSSDKTGRSCTSNDISRIVERYCDANKLIASVIMTALDLAGFGGRIAIEKTSSSMLSIELNEGYAFDVSTMFNVSAKLNRPRVLCVDGYIESVSEIHHLLESLAETREQCLLFVRGMADDVIHTLKVNYDRGTLRVIPICVKFDLEGINTLNDISIVSAANLISSIKGDLISSLNLNDISTIDSAIVYPSKVAIINKRSRSSVLTHIKNLRVKQSKNSELVDVGTLLDKRIKSLSSSHVVIRLPDDRNFLIRSQSIDYVLRAIKIAIETGVIEHNGQVVLATSQHIANRYASKCYELLMSLGGCIQAI